MALIDEVKARIPAQRLIELTNADNDNATTINDILLDKAVQDGQAEFEMTAQTTLDLTNPKMVMAAIIGVIIRLKMYTKPWTEDLERAYERWLAQLERVRQTIGGNNRILPETNSQLSTTLDKRGNVAAVFDAFDDRVFDDLKPVQPLGGIRKPDQAT